MAAPFDVSAYKAMSNSSLGGKSSAASESEVELPSFALEWQGVRYSLPPSTPKGDRKQVLKGVYGRAEAGQLFGILGPSGSGKTSLLNSLAGRVPSLPKGAALDGDIRVCAPDEAPVPVELLNLSAISAYVEQDDALFALSTVEETLRMVAELRLPRCPRKAERVANVIAELGLTPSKDTIIGSDRPGQRGISGGERRRVNVACELLHRPRLIFVDEPTSGLDSFQALNVMETLKDLASHGHTVVLSIHQPRSSIYQLLDHVLLMSEGNAVYSGPAGNDCVAFFHKVGYPVPSNFNPADHFLDMICLDHRNEQELERTQARLAQLLDQRPQPPQLASDVAKKAPAYMKTQARTVRAPFFVTFGLLFRRTWREVMRDRVGIVIKACMQMFFSIIFGTVYWHMDMSQKSFQNRTGILFFMAMNQSFGGVIGVTQAIPRQLKVVQRERAANLYDMFPFYTSTLLTQIPIEAIPQFMYGFLIYTMTGLRPGFEHMLTYVVILLCENAAAMGLGMIISASVSSVEVAPQVAPVFCILFTMFSGMLLNQDMIPRIFDPLKKISFVRYSFQALAVNELKDNDGFSCKDRIARFCFQGNDWLEQLGFENVSISRCIEILLFETLVFHIFAFAILVSKKPRFLRMMMPGPKSSNELWQGM